MPKFDHEAKDRLLAAQEIASFRFGLIAPVVNGLYQDASAIAYYRRVTENPIRRPDGTEYRYEAKTLEKWKSDYDRYGIDALMPKVRSDKGTTKALSFECIQFIREMLVRYPKLGCVQIHNRLVEKKLVDDQTSVRTIQRFVKNEKFITADSDVKDRKAFEHSAFGIMYQGDTCYFPYITEKGKRRRTYLISLVDDHTRVIVAARLFYADNACNFQKVLKLACKTHGRPKLLYLDNGSPYRNKQLDFICSTLGIKILHAPVSDGPAKAKIERYHGVLKQRWLYGLDVENIHSLEEFNVLLNDAIRVHNNTVNSSINQSPMDRYLTAEKVSLPPPSDEWMDEAFLNREIRKVHKDATLSLKPYIFDAPRQFIGQTVEVRFLPDEWENAYIMYDGQKYPLRLTNKNDNAHVKRDNPKYKIDYSKVEDNKDDI
jgi:hypothetical protein